MSMSIQEKMERVFGKQQPSYQRKKTKDKSPKKKVKQKYEFHPGDMIKSICDVNGISTSQLAEITNLSYNHLYMLSRDTGVRNNMGLHAATKLEIATGIPVSYWMKKQSEHNRKNYPEKYENVFPVDESEIVTPAGGF